jgi:hypothetical protein
MDAGRFRFCVGQWLAMLALADDPPVRADADLDAHGDVEPAAEAQALDAWQVARNRVEAFNREQLEFPLNPSLHAFLDQLVADVRRAPAAPGLELHALALAGYVADRAPADGADSTTMLEEHEPFAELFTIAEHCARHVYGNHANPHVRFEVCLLTHGRPHQLAGDLPAVSGRSRVSADGEVAITLVLTGEAFWLQELAASTYVLLHELIVHAFAAPHARLDSTGYAEGWMDFVAHDVHLALTGELLPLTRAHPAELLAGEQLHHAWALHAARSRGTRVVQKNAIAAERAMHELAETYGLPLGRQYMWAYSAALNQSTVRPSDRAAWSEGLGRALQGGDRAAAAAWCLAAREVHDAQTPLHRIRIASFYCESFLHRSKNES